MEKHVQKKLGVPVYVPHDRHAGTPSPKGQWHVDLIEKGFE